MNDLTSHDWWVLSGSLCGWGDVAIPLFELVVYLWLPTDIRLERLRRREHERYGERIMPGGDMCEKFLAFLKWAASYDTGDETIRSRRLHQQWLSTLPCPIVCIEGEYAIRKNVSHGQHKKSGGCGKLIETDVMCSHLVREDEESKLKRQIYAAGKGACNAPSVLACFLVYRTDYGQFPATRYPAA